MPRALRTSRINNGEAFLHEYLMRLVYFSMT